VNSNNNIVKTTLLIPILYKVMNSATHTISFCLLFLLLITTRCNATHSQENSLDDVNTYLKERQQLVTEEMYLSLSGKVVLSPQEKLADDILAKLLVKEAGIMGDNFAPSINFFDAHEWIDNSSIIIEAVRRMPKGAVHHLHYDSSASYDYVLNATYWPESYIYKGDPSLFLPGSLMFFPKQPTNTGWVSVNSLRQSSENVEKFDQDLLDSWTLKDRDTGDYIAIWDKFGDIFQQLSTAFSYTKLLKGHLQHLAHQMLADGVQQIELKVNPEMVLYDLDGHLYDTQFLIDYAYELINATRKIDPSFSLKYIMCVGRHQNYSTILPLLVKSLELRNKYPDLVIGFDLAGPEDEGNTLLYF